MNKNEVINTLIESQRNYGLVDTLHRVFGKNIHINVGFSQSVCNASIEDLALSVRSHNALRRANISTIGELIDKLNEGNIKSIRNLGTKSYSEIQTKMMVYGFEQLSESDKKSFFEFLVENN